jgi:valyl-tRNA synthetase
MSSTTPQPQEVPNRFEHKESSARILAAWQKSGAYHAAPNSDKKPYTIVIPPPNVTGALHLGHALNNTLQDVLIRLKRMQGYETLWMPGTDHAGIATQAVVERRLKEEEGLTRHDLGREKLVQRIWAWKEEYEKRIIGQLKSMGCSCDWDRVRFTLDDQCAAAVRRTFFDLFSKSWLYRGKRLVNWDTFLQTAVSDDEVFHEKVKGHFWHFKYPVIDPKSGEPTHVTIATTRPETMLGDTAVAVHPNPRAAMDKLENELSERLAKAPAKEKDELIAQIETLRERKAAMLPSLELLSKMAADGRKLMLPLLDREIPLVADDWAKPELGSGCVKITPAHDPNDYEVGLRQSLPMINILNPDGTLNANAGDYQGLTIKQARKQVIEDLDKLQLLELTEDREIELGHSDRSKTPIEPYLADQWFIKMDELAQSAMDAVTDGRVKIFPNRYAKGYVDWLSEKRDWPVSRQLWWGHQIPIWSKLCQTKDELEKTLALLATDEDIKAGRATFQVEPDIERQSALEHGDTVQGATKVTLPEGTVHICIDEENDALGGKYEALGFVREQDVLDTWFSSALWPHSTLGWPEKTAELDYFYPTSALITNRDIITLWVARMVLMGLNNLNEVPFHEVFIHPTILDGSGERMSKSKGNGVDPLDVIEKFGPDALRFGMTYLTTETQDVRMPVQFECPHCEALIDQTKKNRELPKIECKSCGKEFSTQRASEEADKALPRGAVVSERFELARNFCNKLWNAARFAMMNLEGYEAGTISQESLTVEDRWLLSRLSTVTKEATSALETYRYADASRALMSFAWDEFCSFYIEMAKERLQDEKQKTHAQQVLTYALDTLLRLLHPIIPFITEEIWQTLAQFAPKRGFPNPETPSEQLITATWPEADLSLQAPEIESQFALFQRVLSSLREMRNHQNIPPKATIHFYLQADRKIIDQLTPLKHYFVTLAGAEVVEWGQKVTPPQLAATVSEPDMEIYLDLREFIDVDKEKARLEKEISKLNGLIAGKEKKLNNENFTSRAPANVVQAERDNVAGLKDQVVTLEAALKAL